MKSLYLVTLDAKINREQAISYLAPKKGFGIWFYSMPSSFFIYSSLSAEDICSMLRENFGVGQRIFVVKVSTSEYFGWMPKSHWEIVNNGGADKRYDLFFKGYYRKASSLPHNAGVYCVYKARYDKEKDVETILELLYIGQAKDICSRHENHNRLEDWISHCRAGEELCYTYAEVDEANLERCEAALIYLNKPICNVQGKDSFGYLDTFVSVTGAVLLLKPQAIAEQTK